MKRNEIIKHYKDFFGLQDMGMAEDDHLMVDWAQSLVKNCNLPVARLSLPNDKDIKEKAKSIAIPYEGYENDNSQRMIGFKQGAEWVRDKFNGNEA